MIKSAFLDSQIKSLENQGYSVLVDFYSYRTDVTELVFTLSVKNQVLLLDDILFNKTTDGKPLYKTIEFNSPTSSDVYYLDRLPKSFYTVLTDYAEISLTSKRDSTESTDFSIILNFIRLTKVKKVRRRKY
ncbi:MAG TPA: hypothetical protein PLS84_03295 [Salinivirgaceae bacterium]|nr:hypothetical protein [Salinivirgaceae bacterium]